MLLRSTFKHSRFVDRPVESSLIRSHMLCQYVFALKDTGISIFERPM
jgi:hypothetical protein